MDDKIWQVKKSIGRLIKSNNLTRLERCNLIKEHSKVLNEDELKLLLKEYHRDFASTDRLKELKDVITMFLTGIGILLGIFEFTFNGVKIGQTAFNQLLLVFGTYIVLAILLLSTIQWYRSSSMHNTQYIIDILEQGNKFLESRKGMEKNMEYKEAIKEGFELYDKIEDEICVFLRVDDKEVSVKYENGIFKIGADHATKKIEADVEITRDEICQMVLQENIEPKEAICRLLRERVCLQAKEYN